MKLNIVRYEFKQWLFQNSALVVAAREKQNY